MNICYNVSKEHKNTVLNLTRGPVKNMGGCFFYYTGTRRYVMKEFSYSSYLD